MPQLPLFAGGPEPSEVAIRWHSIPDTDPLEATMTVVVYGRRSEVLHSATTRWTGPMVDGAPETAMAALAGYLWGSDADTPVRAMLLEHGDRRSRFDALRWHDRHA